MLTFPDRSHLCVVDFIQGGPAFSQVVKRVHETETVGNHWHRRTASYVYDNRVLVYFYSSFYILIPIILNMFSILLNIYLASLYDHLLWCLHWHSSQAQQATENCLKSRVSVIRSP